MKRPIAILVLHEEIKPSFRRKDCGVHALPAVGQVYCGLDVAFRDGQKGLLGSSGLQPPDMRRGVGRYCSSHVNA